jgi:X-Pro dipeptidyl-peptidase
MPSRVSSGWSVIGIATLAMALIAPNTAAAASTPNSPADPAPYVSGGATVPIYSYVDAIRETVWVQTPTDTDADGVPDRVAVDLVRPREAAAAGVKVPVIMEASPYYNCCGRGNESELKEYAADGTVTKMPLYYDNYFVPRGYAFAAVDLIGTARSTGCEDVGGPAEVAGAKAVIDWLGGRALGFAADGRPVRANWTTGKVGMIGKSWDGSIANGVAATGVAGLETIVPISAISNWYGYMRFNGVLRADGYPAFLHSVVTGRPAEACAGALERLNADSAEDTGNVNRFWDARDYRAAVSRVRASVFVVHGINDLNVPTSEFAPWWAALAERGVPRKIWLHQAGHEDPFDVRRNAWVDTLHQWFDFWLQGLRNGIDRAPRASLETAPGVWADERDWPATNAHNLVVRLGAGDGTTGTLGDRGARPGTVTAYQDEPLGEDELVADPNTARSGRLTFLSGSLTAPLRISGSGSVRLRIQVDRPTTELTARLVDYGTATRVDHFRSEGVRTLTTESCWGPATATDDACYRDTAENLLTADHAVLTRGWLDAAHHTSLRFQTPLVPNRWYTVTVPLDAYEAVLPTGHVLGLVLGQSDPQFTNVNDQDATVRVDLAGSVLTLPVAGRVNLPDPAAVPLVRTTDQAGPAARSGPVDTRRVPDLTQR